MSLDYIGRIDTTVFPSSSMTAAVVFLAVAMELAACEPPSEQTGVPPAAATADVAAKLERMRRLHQGRRGKELLEQFQAEDFTAWSAESAREAAEALSLRGQAYAGMKNGRKAEVDLRASLKLRPRNELTWYALADNYARNLNDDRAALAAYQEVMAITGRGNGWLPISSTLEMARILTDQVRADEALQLLDAYGDSRSMAPTWRIRWLRAYGHALASRGDETASLAKFREALEVEAANR